MKIVCISDTHRLHQEVPIPEGDMLIFAGDGDWRKPEHFMSFVNWFGNQSHKHKIMIAGNHDFLMERASPSQKRIYINECFTRCILYLENCSARVAGYNIWGSPITPTFYNWAFMRDRGDAISRVWKRIPSNTDIIITHGPPLEILDNTTRSGNVGCYDLARVIKKIKPKLHVFGHIHSQAGIKEEDDTIFVNASIVDEDYTVTYPPIVIELPDKKKSLDIKDYLINRWNIKETP